jgi:RNA polymerase sigma-70 factor (ECF subfamily)
MLAEQPPMDLNSEENFRKFVLQYSRQAFFFFRGYRFSEEESWDLTQETFLRVYKGRKTFRGESRLDTWLYKIARHIALNAIRSRTTQKRGAQEVSLEEHWGDDDSGTWGSIQALRDVGGGSPLDRMLAAEREEILHDSIGTLPPQMQLCVRLRVEEDLKYKEIAKVMHISIDTVKAHLFQARQLLKDKLSDYFSDWDRDDDEEE